MVDKIFFTHVIIANQKYIFSILKLYFSDRSSLISYLKVAFIHPVKNHGSIFEGQGSVGSYRCPIEVIESL